MVGVQRIASLLAIEGIGDVFRKSKQLSLVVNDFDNKVIGKGISKFSDGEVNERK